uniref:Uncharacterized protein n=1 Tax=Chenopodium quinoa TaxID=63459 RepID=A0A803KWZ8_CHEQI
MAEAFLSEAAARAAGTLTCIGGGSSCLNDMNGCCPGNRCKIYMWQGDARCEWCPSAGGTCGALDQCCPGYTCDSTWPVNGKCV